MAVFRRTRPAASAAVATPISERRRLVREQRSNPQKRATQMIAILPRTMDNPLSAVIEKASWELQAVRPGDHLHVSDLISKCIRKRSIAKSLGVALGGKRLSLSDLLTFAQGDAIHDLLKARARMGNPAQVWGKWSCKCKYLYHHEPCVYDEIDQSETCPHCLTLVDQYHEVSMVNEELMVVGNPDLILYIKALDAYHLTELKSIADTQFKELARPKPEHVLQIIMYWFLMNSLGYRLTDKVSIFYATKAWMFPGKDKPYKEFVIDVQAELHKIDPLLEDARAYVRSMGEILSGVQPPFLPPRMCLSKTTKDAKSCDLCEICFEMD